MQTIPHDQNSLNQTSPNQNSPIIVMGVSGCGKTAIGTRLANKLGLEFIDTDKFHPPANIIKMQSGIPLTDEDRWPWLSLIAQAVRSRDAKAPPVVVACSALKEVYREFLRTQIGAPLRFIHLHGTKQLITKRLKSRSKHFMPSKLLDSQFATLESPGANENVTPINIDKSIDDILNEALAVLKRT